MKIGKFLVVGSIAVVAIWGTIVFKYVDAGSILDKWKMGDTKTSISSSEYIKENVARDIMINRVPGATIVEIEMDSDDAIVKYEGTLVKDGVEYEISVDAITGNVIEYDEEVIGKNASTNLNNTKDSNKNSNNTSNKQSSNYIGMAKAKAIMLSKVPQAVIKDIELDIDDGKAKYEAELIKGNIEYDIEVDAITGKVLKFKKEVKKYSTSSSSSTNNTSSKYSYDYDDDDRYDDDDDDDDDRDDD